MAGVTLLTVVTMCMAIVSVSSESRLRTKKPYQPMTMKVNYYILPFLPYNISGLEPHITEKTVAAHYLGHHQAYQRKMNAALSEWREEVGFLGLSRS